jgi:hypothetical protein
MSLSLAMVQPFRYRFLSIKCMVLINLVFTPGQGLQLFLVAELKFDAFTWLA